MGSSRARSSTEHTKAASTGARGPSTPSPEVGAALTLHGKIGNRAVCRLRDARSGGEPLPAPVRAAMERSFGVSLDPIRVHHGGLADDLGAEALTHRNQIHFSRGRYQPHTGPGRELLGHEIAHVMQQAHGRAEVPAQARGWPTIQRDAALEREADRHGALAARGEVVPGAAPSPSALRSLAARGGAPLQGRIAAATFSELVTEQQDLQAAIKRDPESAENKYTTVGFEHEFAQMSDGPLRGRSHVEVSKTRTTMPLTGLPFILETDAANTLELVSPPLLIDTLEDRPIPLPSEIRKADTLIKTSLLAKTAARPTLSGLLRQFRLDEALDFDLEPVTLTWQNLSPKMSEGVRGRTATLSRQRLGDIQIVPTVKGGGIGTQANFATDAATFVEIERSHQPDLNPRGLFEETIRDFGILEGSIRSRLEKSAKAHLFGMDALSQGLRDFLYIMARNLAGQVAIPSIQRMQAENKRAFRAGEVPDITDEDLYRSSLVKDSGSTWIKDNLFNIGLGMLSADEWRTVKRVAKDRVLIFDITREIFLPARWTLGGDARRTGQFDSQMRSAMNQIYNKAKEFQAMSSMRRSTHTVGPERRVEFLGHKKEWVGPRQDTHLDPRKVQLPKVWDQRLHVVETRRDLDASLALLEGLDPRLRPDDDLEGLDEL